MKAREEIIVKLNQVDKLVNQLPGNGWEHFVKRSERLRHTVKRTLNTEIGIFNDLLKDVALLEESVTEALSSTIETEKALEGLVPGTKEFEEKVLQILCRE